MPSDKQNKEIHREIEKAATQRNKNVAKNRGEVYK